MIWQSMPTEQVMRLKAAGAHRHFEDIVSGRVAPHFVPVLRRAHGRRSFRGTDDALKLKGRGYAYYLRAGILPIRLRLINGRF
jgi:hypothetical protein